MKTRQQGKKQKLMKQFLDKIEMESNHSRKSNFLPPINQRRGRPVKQLRQTSKTKSYSGFAAVMRQSKKGSRKLNKSMSRRLENRMSSSRRSPEPKIFTSPTPKGKSTLSMKGFSARKRSMRHSSVAKPRGGGGRLKRAPAASTLT